MKKKLSKIIIMLFATVLLVAMLVACNENTKQDAVTTDIPDGAKVENNGGVAVKYGNYLYFINGLAGETANNEFGKVVKGAVMRVDLKDGKPVWGKQCTHCMACICYCPAKAIEYGKKSVGKPRYHFEELKIK